ncbi:hypothetical protein ACFWAY_17835 [Rhodococcus sp. NPDC059968]|uniref:hypothetical protein n=1 Tax=Rhodococcus sp. NPDC059968 TaxID=3347017 RepID=UPI00366F1AA7
MTTWILCIGAARVVGGSVALVKRQTVAARMVWPLAALAFAAAFVGVVTVTVISVPLVLAVVVAIVVTAAAGDDHRRWDRLNARS